MSYRDETAGVTAVEFGDAQAAGKARDEYAEFVADADDRRYKLVKFDADLPAGIEEQIEADATEDRQAEEIRSHTASLTDGERQQVKDADGFSTTVTTANWRSAKGVFEREGVGSRFRDAIPALTDGDDPAELAEQYVRDMRAGTEAEGDGTAASGMARDEGEQDIIERQKEADAAQVVQKEAVANARRWCKKGDGDACDTLVEEYGYDREEARRLLGLAEDATDDTEQEELVTVGGDGYPEMEVPPAAAGALRDSWTGYKSATSDVNDALETIREEVANARRSMEAINAIREANGQEEIEAEVLGEQLGALAEMPGSIPNVKTLAEFGIFDGAGYPDDSTRSMPLDPDVGGLDPRGRTDMSRSTPLDIDRIGLGSMEPTASWRNEEGDITDIYTRPDLVLANGQITPLSPIEAAEQAVSNQRFTLVQGDPADIPGYTWVEPPEPWELSTDPEEATEDRSVVVDHPSGWRVEAWVRPTDIAENSEYTAEQLGAGQYDVMAIPPDGPAVDGSDRFHDTAQEAVDAAIAYAEEQMGGSRSPPLDIDTTDIDPRGRLSSGPDAVIETEQDAIDYLDAVTDGYGDRVSMDADLKRFLSETGLDTGAWTEGLSQDVFRYGIDARDVRRRFRETFEESEQRPDPMKASTYMAAIKAFAQEKAGYDPERDGGRGDGSTSDDRRSTPLDIEEFDARPPRRSRRLDETAREEAERFRRARRDMADRPIPDYTADRFQTLRQEDEMDMGGPSKKPPRYRPEDAAEPPEREKQFINAVRKAEAQADWERLRRLRQREPPLDIDTTDIDPRGRLSSGPGRVRDGDGSDGGEFEVEKQQTFDGPEPEETAQNQQVTLTGDAEGENDARLGDWRPEIDRQDRRQYTGGRDVGLAAKADENAEWRVWVTEGSNAETIAETRSRDMAIDIIEEFAARLKPPEVSLHKGDSSVPEAAAEAKRAAAEARKDDGLGAFTGGQGK